VSPLSLRSRVLLGAAFWTGGLFVLGGVALTVAMALHPHSPAVVHRFFVHPVTIATALALLAAGAWQVRVGLSGVDALRPRLRALHDGGETRIEGSYPTEIQPLVSDLNSLLQQRDEAVRRAVATAGDLAHGLKTPLALLRQDAARAEVAGAAEVAASIHQQVDRMSRQMDLHLARARSAASGRSSAARSSIRDSAEGIARVLHRLHPESGVTIVVDVEPVVVRVEREALDEMLGNLLDNAVRFARARIIVSAVRGDGAVVVMVDDDGPGLPEGLRLAVLRRGYRADERSAGSGLGLAIVSDLAAAYGGEVSLDASPLGGLRAALRLPG
jgi:signal transduction histidine kinase